MHVSRGEATTERFYNSPMNKVFFTVIHSSELLPRGQSVDVFTKSPIKSVDVFTLIQNPYMHCYYNFKNTSICTCSATVLVVTIPPVLGGLVTINLPSLAHSTIGKPILSLKKI